MPIVCRTDNEALDKRNTRQSLINESVALAAPSDRVRPPQLEGKAEAISGSLARVSRSLARQPREHKPG